MLEKNQESVSYRVERSIYARPRGSIFFRSSFSKFGSASAIRQTLKRLEDRGVLIRLAQGIYLYPKKHKTLGVILPTADDIAYAIAKRDKARIIPTGVQALNKLGLSTQVPLNAVYLIDGAPRTVKVGNRSIKFKKASPKLLSIKNELNILVIQALREVGEQAVDDNVRSVIREVLKDVDENTVRKDMKLAPVWIANAVYDTLNY